MAETQELTPVHDLQFWSLSGERVALSGHIALKETAHRETMLAAVQAMPHERFGIQHLTLQPEPAEITGLA